MHLLGSSVNLNCNEKKKKEKGAEAGQLFRKLKMPRELLDAMLLFAILLHANNSFPYNFRQKVFGALILTS